MVDSQNFPIFAPELSNSWIHIKTIINKALVLGALLFAQPGPENVDFLPGGNRQRAHLCRSSAVEPRQGIENQDYGAIFEFPVIHG